MRNALAHAGRSGHRVVSAFNATAFAQNDALAARKQWRSVADQLLSSVPKLAALMDHAEPDVLAYMSFPATHRVKLHSTNPLERLNGEIKRRTHVVGIFPNEASIRRLVGAILLEQNHEWQPNHRSPDQTSHPQTEDLHHVQGHDPSEPAPASPEDMLTHRERQVFQMIGRGSSTKVIADQLRLSPNTIESYREKIKAKLALNNSPELQRAAI